MSISKKLLFEDYDNFSTEEDYTTSAEAQDYFRNMDEMVTALIDIGLWQPSTKYANGAVVKSPSMPSGTEAICVAENGGTSSNVEPSWGEVGDDNVSDGTCFWKLRWAHWSKDIEQITELTTGTTNRLLNTTYVVGDVMLHKSNLSVALKCTTAGTTSDSELDISGVSVGESVEDGSVVWKVCNRTSDVTSVNGQTGDVKVGEIVDATISGKNITLTFADGTNKTLTTQDTNTVPKRYITQTYRSGTNWYEVYNDGWVRQGGYQPPASSAKDITITLLKSMKDLDYWVGGAIATDSTGELSSAKGIAIIATDKATSTTSITVRINTTTGKYWEIKGQGA